MYLWKEINQSGEFSSDFLSVMGKPSGMIHRWKVIILGRQ